MPADLLNRLGDRIRKLRKKHGWTQVEFAERVGIDCEGTTHLALAAICEALNFKQAFRAQLSSPNEMDYLFSRGAAVRGARFPNLVGVSCLHCGGAPAPHSYLGFQILR